MRELFVLIEQGRILVRSKELAGQFEPEELAALRAAGIFRAHSPRRKNDRDATEELSMPDLVRTLREIYDVDPRGLPTPALADGRPAVIGWCGSGRDEREVVLVGRSRSGLSALLASRRTLALLPVGRWLTPAERAKHGPDAWVAVEALDEVLVARDGSIFRDGSPAPAPALAPALTPAPAPAAAPRRRSRSPLLPVAGATRWNLVTVYRLDEHTVRIDAGGRSHRRTCGDLGMAHGANRTPTRLWEMFVAFLEGHGSLETSRFGGVYATKQLVTRLRRVLRAAFGLTDDPFHRYVRGEGWRTRFVAAPHPPRGD